MRKKPVVLLLLTFVIALNVTSYAQNQGLFNDLNAKFKKYNLVNLDSRVEFANVKAGRGITLPVGGRQLALSVVENDLRSASYRLVFKTLTGDIKVPRPENTTYKGRVTGDDFSIVRLALDGKKVEGIIVTQGSEYYIEPASVYSQAATANEFIIYEPKDLVNRKEITCPLMSKVEAGMRMVNASFNDKSFKNIFAGDFKKNFARSLPPGNRILNLSTDADYEYIKIFGNATMYSRIQAISNINETLNVVEGLYENTVNVTFNIPYQGGWLVNDPYNNDCETPKPPLYMPPSECVLNEFKDYWNNNRPPSTFDGRNAALLFTGKSIVHYNLAYQPSVCSSPSYAYAMLVGNFPAQGYGNYRYGAAAQEISHLFNAQHIGGQNLDNNPDCYNSIQGPPDSNRPFYGSLRICQFTINEINTHIQNNFCLLIE